MATKSLNTKLTIYTVAAVTGIFTLNSDISQVQSYDDTNVVSTTAEMSTGTNQLIVAAVDKTSFVFMKNTDTTNFLVLKNDAGNIWGRLLPGQWSFFPVANLVGLEVQADTATVTIQYAIFRGI